MLSHRRSAFDDDAIDEGRHRVRDLPRRVRETTMSVPVLASLLESPLLVSSHQSNPCPVLCLYLVGPSVYEPGALLDDLAPAMPRNKIA
jgi:hypothetical protein